MAAEFGWGAVGRDWSEESLARPGRELPIAWSGGEMETEREREKKRAATAAGVGVRRAALGAAA